MVKKPWRFHQQDPGDKCNLVLRFVGSNIPYLQFGKREDYPSCQWNCSMGWSLVIMIYPCSCNSHCLFCWVNLLLCGWLYNVLMREKKMSGLVWHHSGTIHHHLRRMVTEKWGKLQLVTQKVNVLRNFSSGINMITRTASSAPKSAGVVFLAWLFRMFRLLFEPWLHWRVMCFSILTWGSQNLQPYSMLWKFKTSCSPCCTATKEVAQDFGKKS